ncbi:DUF4867 family protein [Metabacillus idriensis]|uniref:DUF4867 family protein n=1 Tax=Metabacillus idriensis TaxID=324768 RepID=UPI002813946E|nr:DUF4867 family protein [Metabacillus idriensis]MDR0138889.1 DUF4867 family protein [Metabacillus idriensis]
MSNFERLKEKNKHLSFYEVNDESFRTYGRIIENYSFRELEVYMETTEIPVDGNQYVASVPQMEKTSVCIELANNFYGKMPVQIGYCNGSNSTLNGLEYHKGSEVNVAVTDFVLLLGKVQDIRDNTYESERADAFFVPKGTAIELYGTTLHFAPCKVEDDGFKAVVILPAGTNEKLEQETKITTSEDELLFMKNKWLIAHPDREALIQKGAYPGIIGENVRVYY